MVPPEHLTVPELLESRLPPLIKESSVDSATAVSSLSIEKPNCQDETLLDIAMPPRGWVAEVAEVLKDSMHCPEASSIAHPVRPNTYLPFDVVYLWQILRSPVEQRTAWSIALEYLNRWKKEPNAAAAQDAIKTIKWGRPTSGLRGTDARSPIGILALFLSLRWLAERHLDLIGLCLSAPPDVVVEVSLATTVKALVGKTTEQILAVTPLDRLRQEVQAGRCKRIFFPTNIDNVHWVAFCVCTTTKTIRYGMRMSPVFACQLINLSWVHRRLNGIWNTK